jgi:hypothetical protein
VIDGGILKNAHAPVNAIALSQQQFGMGAPV